MSRATPLLLVPHEKFIQRRCDRVNACSARKHRVLSGTVYLYSAAYSSSRLHRNVFPYMIYSNLDSHDLDTLIYINN